MTQERVKHPEPLYCATHRDVETYLRCGKCDTAICPKCMVQTPVGARCRDCAQLRPLPQYQVSGERYLRAGGAAVGAALVVGGIWGLIPPLPFGNFIAAWLAGWAVGEVTYRAAGYRSSRGLKILAGSCVVLAYLISVLMVLMVGFGVPLSVLPGVGLGRLLRTDPFVLVTLAIGVYFAVSRIR